VVEERGHGAVLQLDRPTLTWQWAAMVEACRVVARAVARGRKGRGEAAVRYIRDW
jgi:hypothetical protein